MTTTETELVETTVEPPEATQRDDKSPWAAAIGVPIGIALLLAVLVSAFAWPAINSAPRGVDLAIVAPPPALEQVEAQLAAAGEDAFEITTLDDRDAAVGAIEDREVYGALVIGPDGAEVLIASAASPAIAQALTGMATGMAQASGTPPVVTDVVPLPEDDPRGVGLATGLFPLLLGGMALGAVTAFQVRGATRKLTTLALGALLGAMAVVGVLSGWLGAISGSYWTTSLVAALLIFAISSTIVGLHRLLGYAGIGVGALIMIVLGNPLSGVTSAPEMLPAGWGTFGQWLPPGAGGTALRSAAYFGGAGASSALLILAGWAALGVLLLLLPRPARRSAEAVASR